MMIMTRTALLASLACSLIAANGFAQNPGPERLSQVEIRSERVADDLYVLFGFGGNIAVQFGDQGVLMVDSQFPELVPKVKAAIAKVGGGEIKFVINTHWHYDHADGNPAYGKEGVWFISQTESRRRMTMDNVLDPQTRPAFKMPAYPREALPIATFDSQMQFHFNDELIDLKHFSPAHTAGDTAVFFRKHNAVHLGDVFTPRGYPLVDVPNGGDIDGMITFCRAVLAEINESTVVIPGHGPITTYADLTRYTAMLQSVRDKVAELMKSGATLQQVIAAKPTAAWDESYGKPENFIDRVYASLSRAAARSR
jgi:glyoxylase-like metal-dependent hydrolase (beta-lactamase superfamily II)